LSFGEELIRHARTLADKHSGPPLSPTAVDLLRTEAVRLFEALPEPPAYRRAVDPARDKAQALLSKATDLLTRLTAAAKDEHADDRLRLLLAAVEAHVRALAAISQGDIVQGDVLAREAWDAARRATTGGSLFRVENVSSKKIYDVESKESRYDARPEPSLTVQLFCANPGCHRPAPYSVLPHHATHRFICSHCKRPFTGHFAELRQAEAKPGNRGMHYVLRVTPVGSAETVLEFDDASWRESMDVNVAGAMYGCQAAARAMVQAGKGGRLLTISTISANMAQFGFTGYGASKAALQGLTRVMAVELAEYGITANCIAPGPVTNDMLVNLYGEERLRERRKTIPLGRLAEASEIASMAVFLASKEAAYISGQTFIVDGGASAAGCYTMEVYKRAAQQG